MSKKVPITLDKKRSLRYDFNAICSLEEQTGESITAIFGDGNQVQGWGLSKVRTLVWAGLLHEDEALTVKSTGDIIGKFLSAGGTFQDLITKVVQAMQASEVLGKAGDTEGNTEAEAD